MNKSVGQLGLWDFITAVIILAILYGLARPGAPAAAAIADVSTALIAVVGAATGVQATTSSAQTGTDLTTT